jgi:hypothetical protein
MNEKERDEIFNKNPTSMIDYPKGIPKLEQYLVSTKLPFDRNPEDLLI